MRSGAHRSAVSRPGACSLGAFTWAILLASAPALAAGPTWDEVVARPDLYHGAEVTWELEARSKETRTIDGRETTVILTRHPEETRKMVLVLPADPSLGVLAGGVVEVTGRIRGVSPGQVILEEKDPSSGYRLPLPAAPSLSRAVPPAPAASPAPPRKPLPPGVREAEATVSPAVAPSGIRSTPSKSAGKAEPPAPEPLAELTPVPEPPKDPKADSIDFPFVPESEPAEGRVKEPTNVRSGPGTRYKVIGRLERKETFAIEGTRGEWVRVRIRNRVLWVHREAVVRTSASIPSAPGKH